MKNAKVAFVVSPFLPEFQPAIGVSLLSARLGQAGIPCNIHYSNIQFYKEVNSHLHSIICNKIPNQLLLGEMIFSGALYGLEESKFRDYLYSLYEYSDASFTRSNKRFFGELLSPIEEELISLFHFSKQFVNDQAVKLLSYGYEIIGFSTTFQQNIASLALASNIKLLTKNTVQPFIIFGGANCDGEMGKTLVDSFNCIDAVVTGEADNTIVALFKKILDKEKIPKVISPAAVMDINDLCFPNFDDYFNDINGTELLKKFNLCIESSRGCWWGEKHHCTFCGLNAGNMKFRSKTPEKFINEIIYLSQKYNSNKFMVTDNILDLSYIKKVFPLLEKKQLYLKLFYEVKTNLTKEQLIILSACGINWIQPGIESLSTEILKIINKGSSKLQNIQILKWCKELKINPSWNYLYGFPDEDTFEYRNIIQELPKIHHLPPPTGYGKIHFDRFSPFWMNPEKFGLINKRSYWPYKHVYPFLNDEQLNKICYYFDYDYKSKFNFEDYADDLKLNIDEWRNSYSKATLEVLLIDGVYIIKDTRKGNELLSPLTEFELKLIKSLDSITHISSLQQKYNNFALTFDEINSTINKFLEFDWIIQESEKIISLVVDSAEYEKCLNLKHEIALDYFLNEG